MALKSIMIKDSLLRKITHFFTVTKLTYLLIIIAIASGISSLYAYNRVQQIAAFNQAINAGKPPKTDTQSFEAKFATAYWLAKNERYKEARSEERRVGKECRL